ncbi:MAG: PLP-dependent aminotransferase family protein [SAR202 cluster bacterium]|nr:PLP-dependent aminotransferase family protein [SAR202 cluster bacterium]
MATQGLDYKKLYAKNLPPPAATYEGIYEHHFITGHSDPDLIPVDDFVESAERVLRKHGKKLAVYYSDGNGPLGNLAMREYLSKKLKKYRGINASPDEILITSGSTQCILLINDTLIDQGDTVLVEEFTYSGTMRNAIRAGAKVIGVPMDDEGMKIDALEKILADLKKKGVTPKYLYTIPSCQNPTGTNMPMERRKKMLEVAGKYGVPIFEDECYSDLVYEGEWENSIKSLDKSNQVLHIGSLSKSLAPGMRLGYLVAPKDIMSQLVASKVDVGTNMITPWIVADYLEGHYEEHIEEVRDMLQRKRDVLVAALKEHFGPNVQFYTPRGGMVLWIKFPENVDTTKPLEAAKKLGVIYNPGKDWAVDPAKGKNYIRLCFGMPSDDSIRRGIEKLAKAFHDTVGVP